jgi:hypothetical protein
VENNEKLKARELMRSMFTDIKSVTDRKDYLNNKSTSIINKKEELGFKSGKLDLRSFESFYNEVSKKTQVEVEQLYELFLHFINSSSVELVEEKIVFFEKMLYIFFARTEEQLKFWQFYQKRFENKNITETLKKLKLIEQEENTKETNEDLEREKIDNELEIEEIKEKKLEDFKKEVEKISETSVLKAELLVFEKIQLMDKEIKKLIDLRESEKLYENTEEIVIIDKKLNLINEKKEELVKKLKEYEDILKENFYKKESVFLFIESILLGVGEIFEKNNEKNGININRSKGTHYESLLLFFKKILSYTEFKVDDMNDEEFLNFLTRNRVQLSEIFAIVLTDILGTLKKTRNKVTLNDLLEINNLKSLGEHTIDRRNLEESLKQKSLQNVGINQEELFKTINAEYEDIYSEFAKLTTKFLENFDTFFEKYQKVLKYKIEKNLNDILKIKRENAVEIKELLIEYYKFKKKIFFNEDEMLKFEEISNELIKYGLLKENIDKITENVEFSFKNEKVINFNELIYKERRIKEDENSLSEEEIEHLLTEDEIQDFISNKAVFFKDFREIILMRYLRLNIIISNFINKNIFYFPKGTLNEIRKKISKEFERIQNIFSQLDGIEMSYTFELVASNKIKVKNNMNVKELINSIKSNIGAISKELRESNNGNRKRKKNIKLCDYFNEKFEKNVIDLKKYLKKCELEKENLKKNPRPVAYFKKNCNSILKYTIDKLKNNSGLTKKINFIKTNNIEIDLIIKDDKIINEIKAISTIKKILFNNQFEIIVDKIYENNEFEFNSDKEFASFVINTILFNKNSLSSYDENNVNAIKDLGLYPIPESEMKNIRNNYGEKFNEEDLRLILHYLKK